MLGNILSVQPTAIPAPITTPIANRDGQNGRICADADFITNPG